MQKTWKLRQRTKTWPIWAWTSKILCGVGLEPVFLWKLKRCTCSEMAKMTEKGISWPKPHFEGLSHKGSGTQSCMHPITVYGIETSRGEPWATPACVACTLLPFTVLKRNTSPRTRWFQVACTLLPFTVLKPREEAKSSSSSYVACTLLPFTVLKPEGERVIRLFNSRCMHPITVYGIETGHESCSCNTLGVACTLLPFTVLKLYTRTTTIP